MDLYENTAYKIVTYTNTSNIPFWVCRDVKKKNINSK